MQEIENIYKHIDEIDKAGIKKKLEASRENAFLSKDLATIHCEVPIDFDFEHAKFTDPDFEKIKEILFELEFKAIYAKLIKFYQTNSSEETKSVLESKEIKQEAEISFSNEAMNSFDDKKVRYQLIVKENEARKLAARLLESDLFVFDTETDGLNTFEVKLAGASFCIKPDEAYFIALNPFDDQPGLFENNLSDRLPVSNFIKIFKKVFENDEKTKYVEWFSDRTPHFIPSVFAGIQFPYGLQVRFRYYLDNYLNNSYKGSSTYSDYTSFNKTQVWYISFSYVIRNRNVRQSQFIEKDVAKL